MPDRPPLKVLFVTSEVVPFAKTGGLGDVLGALPKALRRRGVDARVVVPLYAGIDWQALERLERRSDIFIIRGIPAPNTDLAQPVRRMKAVGQPTVSASPCRE